MGDQLQLWEEVNLELIKMSKLNHIGLKSKDEKFVLENILWIDNSFRKLFGLRISNRKTFLKLFENDYSIHKRKIDDSFFENFDFTKINLAKTIDTEIDIPDEAPVITDTLNSVFQLSDNSEPTGIVDGYLNSIFITWLSSIEFNNNKITLSCIKILTRWICFLNSIEDKEFHFFQFADQIKYLIRGMHQMHLDKLIQKQGYIADYTSFEIWLRLIFNSETKIEFVEGYFSEITFNTIEAIKSNRIDILKSMIKNVTNGIYAGGMDNGFYQLSELINKRTGTYSKRLNLLEYNLIRYQIDQ